MRADITIDRRHAGQGAEQMIRPRTKKRGSFAMPYPMVIALGIEADLLRNQSGALLHEFGIECHILRKSGTPMDAFLTVNSPHRVGLRLAAICYLEERKG